MSQMNNPPKEQDQKKRHTNMIKGISPFRVFKKHFLLTLLFTLLTLLKPALSENELAKNLEMEFNRIATSFPKNWEKYFYQITSSGQIKVDKFHAKDIEHRLKHVHRFIENITNNFLSIIYADYVVFKTFSFNVSSHYSGYREFVGAARVINDWVEIAYIEINTFAFQVQQYDSVHARRCKTILFFFKECEDYINQIPKGYTMDELELLLYTMKAHSYKHLLSTTKNVLAALQTKEFVLSMNSPYFSDNGAYFLIMQEDGNLVIYERDFSLAYMDNKAVWASQTYHFGQQPYMLVIEKDGELVIYDALWVPLWKARTAGKGVAPFRLEVTNDGDLSLIDQMNKVVWKSVKY